MSSQLESVPSFLPYSHCLTNELNIVSIDHSYAKPWSSHPDASNARPMRMLFMERYPRSSKSENQSNSSELIDVENEENVTVPVYDVSRAKTLMADCERHASLMRPDYAEMRDDWEDHIAALRTSWTALQNRVFAKVMRVLQSDRLARLSIVGTKNEPIQRRLQIDKAAKRIRFAFANVNWDMTLIFWLHNLFLENLKGQLLTSYLEVLQTLKAKTPSLTDRLIEGTTAKAGGFTVDALNVLLKKSWDPVISSINQQKPKKLPGNPLLLLIPSTPSMAANPLNVKRNKFWQNQLASMGKVVNVVPINNSTNITIANCVENMIASTRSKILEVKGHFPGRHIVLIGWHVGALVASQVALMETVHAVVCLGFPTMGVCGNRWDIDDNMYGCKTPTLFMIGQHASSTTLDSLEEIREKLRVDTGLVVVGGADDQLRMSRAKKRSCTVTQAMVDRCLMDEMIEFLGNILSQALVQPEPVEEVEIIKKQRKRKQKDTNTAAGSQTVGGLLKQTGKAAKVMKQGKMKSGAESVEDLLSNPGELPAGFKYTKKGPSKKRVPKASSAGKKSSILQLNFPSSGGRAGQSGSLSATTEAAAIASAPELSNLLQSIKTSEAGKSVIGYSPSQSQASSTMVQTTTALTLSRFLAQSGFFRNSTVSSADPVKENTVESPLQTLASTERDSSHSSLLNETLQRTSEDPLLSMPTSSTSLSSSTAASPKQQPQILVRTGTSSAPFSIPLTFSMASKVLKTTPVMRITGSGASTSQIQQLLTSMSCSAHALTTTTTTTSVSKSSSTSSEMLKEMSSAASSSITSIAQNLASHSTASSFAVLASSGPTPTTTSASAGSMISSPGASIINIGSDTVLLREASPITSSAPGTVSIDLGQIAANNSSSSSSNIMKIKSSPKISLVPPLKQLSGLTSSSKDTVLLTQPPTSSLSSSSSSSSSSSDSLISVSTTSASSSQQGVFLKAAASKVPPNTKALSFSSQELLKQVQPMLPIKSSQKSLTITSLPTTSGLVTLKLAPSALISGISSAPSKSPKKDEADGTVSSTLGVKQTQGNLNYQLHDFPSASGTKPHVISSLAAPTTKPGFGLIQKMQLLDQTSLSKPFSTSTPVIITSTSKSSLSSPSVPGQIVVQCRNSAPSGISPATPTKPSSPKVTLVGSSETLGQVTSLLESNPVKLASQGKASFSQTVTPPMSTAASCSETAVKQGSKALPANQGQSSCGTRASKTTVTSYTTTTKPVLPTVASTRTRRIKTPKQYDL